MITMKVLALRASGLPHCVAAGDAAGEQAAAQERALQSAVAVHAAAAEAGHLARRVQAGHGLTAGP